MVADLERLAFELRPDPEQSNNHALVSATAGYVRRLLMEGRRPAKRMAKVTAELRRRGFGGR
jgi:hypothetical protein